MSKLVLRTLTRALASAVLALTVSATPGEAQVLSVGVGSSLYDSDGFCLGTEAALSGLRVGVSGGAIGGSIAYNNEDWPWPRPPGGGGGSALVVPGFAGSLQAGSQQNFFMTRGEAIQGVFEVYPLGLSENLRENFATVRRYVTPFVGVGVMIASDGDPAAATQARPLPTYGVKGGTDFLVTYGGAVHLPTGRAGLRLMVQVRGNTLFARGIELIGPAGDRIDAGNQTLTWGEWLVGINIGP